MEPATEWSLEITESGWILHVKPQPLPISQTASSGPYALSNLMRMVLGVVVIVPLMLYGGAHIGVALGFGAAILLLTAAPMMIGDEQEMYPSKQSAELRDDSIITKTGIYSGVYPDSFRSTEVGAPLGRRLIRFSTSSMPTVYLIESPGVSPDSADAILASLASAQLKAAGGA